MLNLVRAEMALIRRAGDLADRFGPRGCDSLHLSAAEWIATGAGTTITFARFDSPLNDAALSLGLTLLA